MSNITYTYQDCNKEDFSNDVSFSEDNFSEKLSKVFELSLGVERVEVVVEKDNSKMTVKVHGIVDGKASVIVDKSGQSSDASKVARDAINTFVAQAQNENNKK